MKTQEQVSKELTNMLEVISQLHDNRELDTWDFEKLRDAFIEVFERNGW